MPHMCFLIRPLIVYVVTLLLFKPDLNQLLFENLQYVWKLIEIVCPYSMHCKIDHCGLNPLFTMGICHLHWIIGLQGLWRQGQTK